MFNFLIRNNFRRLISQFLAIFENFCASKITQYTVPPTVSWCQASDTNAYQQLKWQELIVKGHITIAKVICSFNVILLFNLLLFQRSFIIVNLSSFLWQLQHLIELPLLIKRWFFITTDATCGTIAPIISSSLAPFWNILLTQVLLREWFIK